MLCILDDMKMHIKMQGCKENVCLPTQKAHEDNNDKPVVISLRYFDIFYFD